MISLQKRFLFIANRLVNKKLIKSNKLSQPVITAIIECYVIVLLKSRLHGLNLIDKLDYILHKNDFWLRAPILFGILKYLTNNVKINGFNIHRRFLDCVSSFYLLSANINTIKTTFDVKTFFETSIDFLTIYLKNLE